MTEEWRLLQTGAKSAAFNMAADRAVLMASSEGQVSPTVRFYEWTPSAISIGYFQSIVEEVDLEKCRNMDVDCVRRITGGGAVFHEKELTYSIVIPESHPEIPKNIMKSYGRICGAVTKGLKNIGIDSEYKPINDIIANSRKISGNAQTRKHQTVLQHGTVLLDVDVEKMFNLLLVPDEKIRDKMISDVKQRVTSIRHILGDDIPFNNVADAMKKGFEEEFDVKLVPGKLTAFEKGLTSKFEFECFGNRDWNHKR